MPARIGILHPGMMGASVAASAAAAGNDVSWASHGRSESTKARAGSLDITDAGDVTALAERSGLIISVCPPGFAIDLAAEVAATGFAGLYLDANAVSPATGLEVARIVSDAGATAVDGGIIGPPAWSVGTTRMYVSGEGSDQVVNAFSGGLLSVIDLDAPLGAASALKMAYAGWTKGSSALLLAIAAFAVRVRCWRGPVRRMGHLPAGSRGESCRDGERHRAKGMALCCRDARNCGLTRSGRAADRVSRRRREDL